MEAALLAELEGLGRTIARAKQEILSLRIEDVTAAHIPGATDELDAIVEHTAQATNEILDSCETLERLTLEGEAAETLQSAITRIYEACSFPGHHRPAHRQGGGGAQGDRSAHRIPG
jgi:chemotaxis protein CheZ